MDDLRQRLVALSERTDDALAFERLRARRARKARSRRVATAVLAAIVAVAGIGLAISAFSDDHRQEPGGGSITWHRYTDPSGWSIDVPNGWSTGTIHTPPGNGAVTNGAEFRSAPFPSNGGYGYWGTPHGVVAVILGTARPEGIRDASFPLGYRDTARVDGGRMMMFKVDGRAYALWVLSATTLTPRVRAIVERMVSSISFPSWTPGEARDGMLAFALHHHRPLAWKEAGIDWIELPTGSFAYFAGPSDGTLVGPIPACDSVGGVRSASTSPRGVLLRCAGEETRGWTASGEPFASNAKRFAYPLVVFPVIRSWDGVPLTSAGIG